MKNELQTKRIEKQYEEFYKLYNKITRPKEEQKEVREVEGLVIWNESRSEKPNLRIVK